MSILARTRTVATKAPRNTPAKPLPFGDGIEPAPRQGAYGKRPVPPCVPAGEMNGAPGGVARPGEAIPPKPGKLEPWVVELRKALLADGFRGHDISSIVAWVRDNGTAFGCIECDKSDVRWIDELVAKHGPAPATLPTVPTVDIPPPARTYQPFRPTAEDARTAAQMFGDEADRLEDWREQNPDLSRLGFVARLDALSKAYRARGGDFFAFVGAELERVAQLASFLGATDPSQFETRRDQSEADARAMWEARGYEAGYESFLDDNTAFDGCVD
jgi:hypothetical protein